MCIPLVWPSRMTANFFSLSLLLCYPAVDGRSKPRPESSLPHLPVVEAYQRHELTLLRMEDILNHGSESSSGQQGSGRVSSAAELCHRMVDFCQVGFSKFGYILRSILRSFPSLSATDDGEAKGFGGSRAVPGAHEARAAR